MVGCVYAVRIQPIPHLFSFKSRIESDMNEFLNIFISSFASFFSRISRIFSTCFISIYLRRSSFICFVSTHSIIVLKKWKMFAKYRTKTKNNQIELYDRRWTLKIQIYTVENSVKSPNPGETICSRLFIRYVLFFRTSVRLSPAQMFLGVRVFFLICLCLFWIELHFGDDWIRVDQQFRRTHQNKRKPK